MLSLAPMTTPLLNFCKHSLCKVSVPDKVRVVGFDDVKLATLMNPSLTTIHPPCREIAQSAFRAMLERQIDQAIPGRQLTLAPRYDEKWWALFVAELARVPGLALRYHEGTVTSSSTFINHHFSSHPLPHGSLLGTAVGLMLRHKPWIEIGGVSA